MLFWRISECAAICSSLGNISTLSLLDLSHKRVHGGPNLLRPSWSLRCGAALRYTDGQPSEPGFRVPRFPPRARRFPKLPPSLRWPRRHPPSRRTASRGAPPRSAKSGFDSTYASLRSSTPAYLAVYDAPDELSAEQSPSPDASQARADKTREEANAANQQTLDATNAVVHKRFNIGASY